jgi:hypothetical protein
MGGKALKRFAEQLAVSPPKPCYALDHVSDSECRACEWQEPWALMCSHESLVKPAVAPVPVAEKAEAPKNDGLDDLDRELDAASAKKK